MFKKAVTYENLFAEEGDLPTTTEVLHFHLYLAQIIDLELHLQEKNGDEEKGLVWELQQVGKPLAGGGHNGARIMDLFKTFIKASYGSREGDQFIQTDEKSQQFIRSAAFDAFLQLLLGDEVFASEFINGIMPKALLEQAGRSIKDNKVENVSLPEYPAKATEEELRLSGLDNPLDDKGALVPWWDREPTKKEQEEMSKTQFMDVFRRKSAGWTPRGA